MMKRTVLVLLAAVAIAASTGCRLLQRRPSGCNSCNSSGGGLLSRKADKRAAAQAAATQTGPTAAQVTYPYYTTRGPRDFLMGDPPSIGR